MVGFAFLHLCAYGVVMLLMIKRNVPIKALLLLLTQGNILYRVMIAS